MVSLGGQLAQGSRCTSCMDNTDGISQSLSELAENSGVRFVIDLESISIPPVVSEVSKMLGLDPLSVAFGPGADFPLIGTYSQGAVSLADFDALGLQVIGHVETGSGV